MPHGSRRRLPRPVKLGLYGLGGVAGLVLTGVLAAGGYGAWVLLASRPQLEGTVAAPGLTDTVQVARDAQGVPTLTGRDRADVAWGLGYLHAQERYFQMDLLRRSAAGELAELVGSAALPLDRGTRLHRFRARLTAELERLAPEERQMLNAYTAGVNAGLAGLGTPPFEYALLRKAPVTWQPTDTLLAGMAMYFNLQQADGSTERRLWRARGVLGTALADFLYPIGTRWDAPLDGTVLPTPPIPDALAMPPGNAADALPLQEELPVLGSNNWAVGGALTAHGGGMVANDMHLGHAVPNVWYRARLVVTDGGGTPVLDVTGVSLPGTPFIIAGSNGQVAWGFTNSQIDTSDVVILEPAGADAYLTPDGPRTFESFDETICAGGTCETLTVRETIWGPVIGEENGLTLAYRWVAHDPGATTMTAGLALERAERVEDALAVAVGAGIPNQNLVVADRQGSLAWTVIGRVPNRFGFDGRTPVSFADGTRGWNGWVPAERVPTVVNPPHGRLWTANGRVVGGAALALLGEGDYAHGVRARQIRDALFAKERFTEADLLAIQLDDRATLLDRWHGLMRTAVAAAADRPEIAALAPHLAAWDNRAVPEAVGYRLVRQFRTELITAIYSGLAGRVAGPDGSSLRVASGQADEPAWRLLEERPAHLVPPPYADWDALLRHALDRVVADVAARAGGDPARYSWGARNTARIRHPLSSFVPGLGWLTDAPAEPLPGDVYQPRAQSNGYGASERFVVAPGREADGIFHMPGGQSGHPLAPYYLAGHDDWVAGRPSPFLPGPAVWTLRFTPGQ